VHVLMKREKVCGLRGSWQGFQELSYRGGEKQSKKTGKKRGGGKGTQKKFKDGKKIGPRAKLTLGTPAALTLEKRGHLIMGTETEKKVVTEYGN